MHIDLTLVGQTIAFGLLVWFVHKVLLGPLQTLLSARQKRIADGLAAGERGRHELELAHQRAAEVLRSAKATAERIVAEAERHRARVIEEAGAQAKVEGERWLAAARAEFDQEVRRTKEGLRAQVGRLALAGAEKILRQEVDHTVHVKLLAQLESSL
ncbi:MAG: F0F1 ATP synthase subunit B [Betaproteobacteria bacterium]|nr:F0F1 ATP synthase subunit B [Betaproteobacteria bacterium]